SLDGYFLRQRQAQLEAPPSPGERSPEALDRRVATAKLATGALVGGFVVFCGGIAAAAGRVFGHTQTAGDNGVGQLSPNATGTTGPGTTPTTGPGTGTGTGGTSTTVPGGTSGGT